jgi:Restriction endonuclease/Topoisomerase DNA binding C4 zinc finger
MKRNSLIEDMFEMSIKSPAVGLILSIIFAGVGLFMASKQSPSGAKPAEMLTLPVEHVVGSFLLILAAILFLLSGIGYAVAIVKRKKGTSILLRRPISAPSQTTRTSRFSTKEEYFRWKESSMSKPADNGPVETAPQQEGEEQPVINEKPSWTSHLIYDALGKIDWYQFEKFSAALLHSEGYMVERKGGAYPDGGVDLIGTKDGETMLVQCKHWKTWDIKPKTVREMIGTMKIHNATEGAIYTLKGASNAAMDLANEQGIRIETGYGLADRASRQLLREQLDDILSTDVHHCPKCESEMVWREGNFKPFWGCSRYPRCRGKLEYTGAR